MSKHTNNPTGPKNTEESVPTGTRPLPDTAVDSSSAAITPAADSHAGDKGGKAVSGVVAATGEGGAAMADETQALKAELASARQKVDELQSKYEEANEKYLRILAEEVNFRKRMTREKDEAGKYAISGLLSDLIPILDDFDRGIASAESATSYEKLHEGILLIQKQLSQMLENKYSLKRFESKGKAFDPNKHEALFAEPAAVEEATVAEEYLPGYALHDRVLRTAKVRVKIPAPKKDDEKNAPETGPGSGGNGDTGAAGNEPTQN